MLRQLIHAEPLVDVLPDAEGGHEVERQAGDNPERTEGDDGPRELIAVVLPAQHHDVAACSHHMQR